MPEAFKDPLVYAVIAWLAKEIYQSWKDKSSKATKVVEANIQELRKIELTLARLEVELHSTLGLSKEIPKLQRDVDVAHSHLRLIAPQLYSPSIRSVANE